ncbi:MAG: hypothetical protein ACOH1X_04255 [Kaistella sp.]
MGNLISGVYFIKVVSDKSVIKRIKFIKN